MATKYKQKKMIHKVSVRTLPNGYALDVDGNGYQYFKLNDLIEGFFIHVGIKIVDYMDQNTMHNLLLACSIWEREGQAMQASADLQAQNEALHHSHQRDTKAIATLKADNAKIAQELAKLKQRLNYYVSEEEKANRPKQKAKKSEHIHRCEVEVEKKHIKVAPGPKPVEMKPARKPGSGRPRKIDDEHEQLKQRLREKGVLK